MSVTPTNNSNKYTLDGEWNTIARLATKNFDEARKSLPRKAYPEGKEIVKRAEDNVAKGNDPFNDLWMGDLIYANAISAVKILPKLVGPRALRDLMKRGLVDRDEEDGRNVLEERAIRYAAACSVRLAQGVETALSKVSHRWFRKKRGVVNKFH
jgi:hypothetical protein